MGRSNLFLQGFKGQSHREERTTAKRNELPSLLRPLKSTLPIISNFRGTSALCIFPLAMIIHKIESD